MTLQGAAPPEDLPSPSRREFLARSAALAGAAALASACRTTGERERVPVAAPGVPLAKAQTIRMGVIGTGGMGTAHCQAFLSFAKEQQEDVSIVALCDVCEPRLENARKICAEAQGIDVATTGDHHELLARDDLHGVLIAVPEHWHTRIAEDAILAGKDVYLEKPMALHLDDALRLRRVSHANPERILQIGTQGIMQPKYSRAREVLAQGGIGTPTLSQTSYCRNSKDGEWLYYAIDPAWKPGVNLDWKRWCAPIGLQAWDPALYARWRRYRRTSTGILGDLLVHVMTPLMYATDRGWPVRVTATGGHLVDKAMENHDQVDLTVAFEREHTMIVTGSTSNEVGLETLIRGHEANIYLGGRHCVVRPERIFSDDVDERTIECPDIGNDQDRLRRNWLRCIRTREPVASNADLGTKVMVVVDLATRSMWDGRAWSFDPDSMRARAI